MAIYDHINSFAGKSVEEWTPKTKLDPNIIYRISLDYDESEKGMTWLDKFADFLDTPSVEQLTGLVIGQWDMTWGADNSSARVVEALVTAHDRLPNLTALFIGEMVMEESEISWINQSDVSPLFDAYPKLEYFTVRGGNNLSLGSLRHESLKSLVIQSGGLDINIVREVINSYLPNLTHLELWLGTEHYGWNGTIEDVLPLLSGDLFPSLKYLGLRDSMITDEIAEAVAKSPLLERIEVLDLSMGTLGDIGAKALIESTSVRKLKKLDLHHHYCSDEMMEKLKSLGIPVDLSQEQDEERDDGRIWRYVAVSE